MDIYEILRVPYEFYLTATRQDLGLLGDFFGGLLGTIFSGLALIYLAKTFKATQVQSYMLTTQQTVYQMIEAYEGAVEALSVSDSPETGKSFFKFLLNEFDFIFISLDGDESDNAIFKDRSIKSKIDICFIFLFYGKRLIDYNVLSNISKEVLESSFDKLDKDRNEYVDFYPDAKIFLRGHERNLGHYFRIIYATYIYIDSQKGLSASEKYMLCKQVRIRLSNYEQALLALNIISRFGKSWRDHDLLRKYQPIKNIPLAFFVDPTGFYIKEMFPEIKFEEEEILES